jgi:hypothetical protein
MIGTQDVTGGMESRLLMGDCLLMGVYGPTGSGHVGLPNRTLLFGNRGCQIELSQISSGSAMRFPEEKELTRRRYVKSSAQDGASTKGGRPRLDELTRATIAAVGIAPGRTCI